MNFFRLGILSLGIASMMSCQPSEAPTPPFNHLAVIDMENNGELPVHFDIHESETGLSMTIVNGEDRLDLKPQLDSTTGEIFAQLPFDGQLWLWKNPYGGYRGQYVRESKSLDQDIEILPTNTSLRFPQEELIEASTASIVHETYAVNIEGYGKCVIEFYSPNDSTIQGSVLTRTGDLRYMVGNWTGNSSLKMSTFDGVFAFVLEAHIDGDSIHGALKSGANKQYNYHGTADSEAALDDPTQITHASPDANWDLHFPTYDGGALQSIHPSQNKVTIIQIMGSWCPNCLDEGKALQKLYEQHGQDGLGVFALTFERSEDRTASLPAVSRIVEHTGITYPVLFAGKAYRGAAEVALPIENFISYPTYIVLDSRGEVLEIHAGFSGPGTTKYAQWYADLEQMIVQHLGS